MTTLNGRVVIITGASSGFGEHAARLFSREGCQVVLAARRLEKLELLAGEIRAKGGEALPIATDVTQHDQIQAMVKSTIDRYGSIDILFNNAGFGRLDWLEALDPIQDIERQIIANLLGVIWTAAGTATDVQTAKRTYHQHVLHCRVGRTSALLNLFRRKVWHSRVYGSAATRVSAHGNPCLCDLPWQLSNRVPKTYWRK